MFTLLLLLVGVSDAFAFAGSPGEHGMEARIAGGTNGSIIEVPYMVSILLDGKHICGGTLISENWIVSAAQCLHGPVDRYAVRAGSSLRDEGGVVRAVETYVNHPSYESPTIHSNDISLVKVVEPFVYATEIYPIPLPGRRDTIIIDDLGIIAGFGREENSDDGPLSPVVKIDKFPVLSNLWCQVYYIFDGKITDDMLCAGFAWLQEGLCQGDEGGGLIMYGKLHGIMSWSRGCGQMRAPGVFTRITNYVNWINEVTGL